MVKQHRPGQMFERMRRLSFHKRTYADLEAMSALGQLLTWPNPTLPVIRLSLIPAAADCRAKFVVLLQSSNTV